MGGVKINMDQKKPIKMEFKIKGGTGGIIPKNLIERLIVMVRDGSASYRFNNSIITKKLAVSLVSKGKEAKYIERMQTTFCLYPGMNQKEIVEHISKNIKELEAKNGG